MLSYADNKELFAAAGVKSSREWPNFKIYLARCMDEIITNARKTTDDRQIQRAFGALDALEAVIEVVDGSNAALASRDDRSGRDTP